MSRNKILNEIRIFLLMLLIVAVLSVFYVRRMVKMGDAAR